MPEHACVRIGPLGGGTLIARWPQGRVSAVNRCQGGRVTGMVLVAGARASSRLLEAADVIVVEGEAASASPGEWLGHYPGCAVVAAWAQPGECSVATRDGGLSRVVSSVQGAVGAFACGVFVHGWLAAGLPARTLRAACLEVSYDPSGDAGPEPGNPLFFRFSY